MKPISLRLLLGALLLSLVAPVARAQSQSAEAKGPVAKIFMAEAKGDAQIQIGEKIFPARQSAVFDAQGAVIETKAKSRIAVVFSDGTGLFLEENTRLEITRFVQQPLQVTGDGTLDVSRQLAVSETLVTITRGTVAICASPLLTGSSMVYNTPHASVILRGGKLAINVLAKETRVDLVEGDVTVRALGRDTGGQVLQAGERAAVLPARAADPEPAITITPIAEADRRKDEQNVAIACAARKAVTFETDEAAGAGDQEIVPRPTVPVDPPSNVVVSPDRLPGT